jgi:DNA helicase II / ATP-dependent DNA helicase PcrA
MRSMNFDRELKKLNKQQRKAVETIEGPVMVVAGPGTGKTQILTLRIANILQKTDTSPESILALTFTESAVVAMKRRLLGLIGPAAHKVAIKTIHGFCNEIIQEYPDLFPMIAGEHNVSEIEQIKIIRGLLETTRQRFARDIVGSISELKREALTPQDFSDPTDAEAMAGKHEELSQLYDAYQKELQRRGRYDYDDMVLSVAQVLRKNPIRTSDRKRSTSNGTGHHLLYELREKYLYILVDEHQDTNQSQNDVIELLAGADNPNLFVVGDGKQAIYRFQGAQLENFAYFKKRFKHAAVITLTDNYRSTQTILDAALDIAFGHPSAGSGREARLIANVAHPKRPINIAACTSTETEPYVIARHIEERIKHGVRPEDIAVLYRTNKDSAPIVRYLEKLGVPVSVTAGDDAFSNPQVRKLIVLLEAVRDFGSDYGLAPALYLDVVGVAPLDAAVLTETARREHCSMFSLIRDKKILEKIIPESAQAAFALYQKLSLWKAMSKSFNLMPMFEGVVREMKLIEAGKTLFPVLRDAIVRDRNTTLEDFLDQLQIMRDHRVSVPSSLPATSHLLPAVQLMTAHKAKGLEFDYVYILGTTSSQWESRRNRNLFRFFKKEKDEDSERNLFYVALTRAKKELVISYAKTNADGKEQLASMFVTSIRPELIKELALEKFEKEFAPREIEFRQAPKIKSREKDFWRQRFLEKGLSVSALNNYVECPNKFYFLNLVGLPEAPHAKAQAGNAAHAALKYAIDRRARGEGVTKQQFLDRFALLLSKEAMREIDYRQMLTLGKKVLSEYFDSHSKTWNETMKCEYPISEVKVGRIALRGRLDRVDMLGDGRVRVIDYKFKKPMTRNEIVGKTKNSDGNYYRQLTFYKLLIERGTKWKMQEAVLDFLEPSFAKVSEGQARPKFKQEVFAPSDTEVRELELEIKRVSEEILELEFLSRKCEDKECKYCALRYE